MVASLGVVVACVCWYRKVVASSGLVVAAAGIRTSALGEALSSSYGQLLLIRLRS